VKFQSNVNAYADALKAAELFVDWRSRFTGSPKKAVAGDPNLKMFRICAK